MMRFSLSQATRDNLLFMRTGLILLALSIVTSLALYLGGEQFKIHHQQHQAEARQTLDAARQSRAQAGAEQENIQRFLSTYQTLRKDRQIGEERRLDWIDELTHIRQQRKLFPIEYDIGSRRPYPLAGHPAAKLKISASRMNVKLPLLHENDLFALLGDLRAHKVGLFMLDSCDITRIASDENKPVQFTPNLTAECALDWLTLENAVPADASSSPRK